MRTYDLVPPLSLALFGCLGLCNGKDKDAAPYFDNEDGSPLQVNDASPAEVTVFVTHPDGDAYVTKGEIQGADGTVLSTFAHISGNRWYAELDWAAVNARAPLSFDGSTSLEVFLVFTSEWDVAASTPIDVEVRCASDPGACDGACVDFDTNADHCGECGNACAACDGGSCVALTDCTSTAGYDGFSVDDACVDLGFARCQPATYDGVDDVMVLYGPDKHCEEYQLVQEGDSELYTDTPLDWPDGTYFRAMCVD